MPNNLSFSVALIAVCLSVSSCSENPQVQGAGVAATSDEADTAVEAAEPAGEATGCVDSKGIRPDIDLVIGNGQATSILNVAFVGEQPPADEIDRVLRACVRAAAQVDASRDILGTAWFRKNAQDDPLDDEIINNYGPLHYLSYQASTKSIEVRKIDLSNK